MCCWYIKNELTLDAEFYSDLEYLFIENGSLQKDLCGINIYPKLDD